MKNNIKTKTHNLYKIVFLFVVFLGIGYAFLEANLNINGDVTVEAPELNVYVQSTSVTSGSTVGTPTIIGNDKREVDFTTALTSDVNSFFETTTTLTNKGSKDAYLQSIDVKVYDGTNEVTLAAPYEYTLTNNDGTVIEPGHKLTINGTDTYKIKFNYISGTDMSTVTTYPSYTFKIIYNYGLQPVCKDNENITTLSTNKCTANENVTVPAGTVCKRALNLHQEECTQTSDYCNASGYTINGSKGTSTITYGQCGTIGTLTSGDAFTCDVNGDGEFNELAERFYYVSDYYDTTNKEFDTSTATLIYYNNIKNGIACNMNNNFEYSLIYDIYLTYNVTQNFANNYGPITIMKQLPTISQWSNIQLKNSSRAILAEYDDVHDSPTTGSGSYTLPTDFSYTGYAARFLTAKELMNGCDIEKLKANASETGELEKCSYLLENTNYSNQNITNVGFHLESPMANNNAGVWVTYTNYRAMWGNDYLVAQNFSARPVIEVPKNKISY